MNRFSRWQPHRCVALALVVLFGGASAAFAQFDRGTISGTIRDPGGLVVPGVTVTLTSTTTQQSRTTVSDGSGFYTFPNLLSDVYDVSAELQGFRRTSRSGVRLDAGGSLIIDFALTTGAITEEVTVTAEASVLQTEVAVRKTVEAKDIELLSFSGRNPIGVPALKAGVIGGNFNNAGFSSLTNGGFNINGGRADENTITVDGAVAIRTRSSGATIGVQNVDVIQEVQVLTANYMPEYGRASGGQIRFITKSGSNRYSGSASYFWRDDSLQANTWARNRSTAAADQDPAPFDYKQYGYAFGGPVPGEMFRNKLFFFGAQEWVNFFQVATNTATVPTAAMRTGDFSQLLGSNPFFNSPRIIRDPVTGLPFPNNVIPQDRLSPNGVGLMNLYPDPTPGFQQGSANLIQSSDNPQDQRKDNIRVDYRVNNNHSFNARYTYYNWVAIDAFRGTFPFARTDWERPNWTTNFNLMSTLTSNLINEASYSYSKDQVFINVFTESGLHRRSRTGINYPYIFPGKEIEDKIPTVNIDTLSGFDGGPYPAFSEGPIHVWANTTTYVRGRHTFKAGVSVEYSGEDDFDQINVSAIQGGTNNQNGQFEFRNNRTSGLTTGTAMADMAMGLFQTYAELGQRAFTRWRSLATDIFVQDSWKPRSDLTIEGGVRYVIWPPWYSTTNNIANFDPTFYDVNNEAVMNPSNGRLVSGPRYNGIVLPADGFEGDGNDLVAAQDPRVQALFRGEPRGFSKTHYNVFEPRLGVSYSVNEKTVARGSLGVFHNRVTLNDSTLLGGNPPFQPMVAVNNGFVDDPGGGGSGATDLAFAMQAIDTEFKHPTAYMWSAGVQREIPYGFIVDATYVGRRGLYLQRERNINQLPEGTRNLNPGVAIEALRPYKGYNTIRLSENAARSIYHSLQLSGERRYANGLKFAVAYTLSKSEDNGSDKRNVLWNSYDDTNYWGLSNFDRTHVLVLSYIYDLPFWQDQSTLMRNLLGGWQISGATFMRSGTPFSIVRTNDIAGVGGGDQPVDVVGDINANANGKFSNGSDDNYMFNPAAFANPAAGTFGNQTRNLLRNPGDQQWDIALFKNFRLAGTHRMQFRMEVFNFPNHPNLSGPNTDITSANFGRSVSKDGNRRDIQLALRYLF
ncbi:MAG TPA: carboxypeptidase-like regulatory domain-containing protein [Vicinamibacterales bacterium]|nr:carboxypeptidase-like regulatory domain-containing protein [Vicinamibacterales bacterium]